jgi:hypothetical protein
MAHQNDPFDDFYLTLDSDTEPKLAVLNFNGHEIEFAKAEG